MKLAAFFLTACVVLAAAQAVAVAAVALSLLALTVSLIVAPKETFGLLASGVVVTLATSAPVLFMGLVAMMIVANIISRSSCRR